MSYSQAICSPDSRESMWQMLSHLKLEQVHAESSEPQIPISQACSGAAQNATTYMYKNKHLHVCIELWREHVHDWMNSACCQKFNTPVQEEESLKSTKITTIELESLQLLHLNLIYIEEVHKYKGTTIYKLQKQRDIKSSRDKQALEEDGSVMHLTAQTDNASLSTLFKRQDVTKTGNGIKKWNKS